MDEGKKSPTTLLEAVTYFGEYQNCREYMVNLLWPSGKVICPRCGSDNVSYLPNARLYKCYAKPAHSQQKFSLKVGTIFEDSAIGLEKWLPVMWMLVNCKNGISSWEIHRVIGVTQKTAWFMLQRARLAMQDDSTGGRLSGEGEIDETFIGGKARNMRKSKRARVITGTGGNDRAVVMGLMERGGKVRAMVLDNRKKSALQSSVKEHLEAGAAIFTDELKSYDGLESEFQHQVINHAVEYVNGNVHTNAMENFWSLLKRGLHGTYVSVEPFHLFRYIDEQSFRFNNRGPMNDSQRFSYVMRKIVGKRLTYAELAGKMEVGTAEGSAEKV